MLLVNILIGFFALSLCLMVQALLLKVAFRYYRFEHSHLGESSWASFQILCVLVALLVLGNLLQVGVWATLFLILGEFSDFAVAYYYSAVNFSTLGYGDLVMSDRHRVLGPLEAINGILMVGVTTATLMSVLGETMKMKLKIAAKGKKQ